MKKSMLKVLLAIVLSFSIITFQGIIPYYANTVYSESPGSAVQGLTGYYYDNKDFTDLKMTRIDSAVEFDWGTGSPVQAINPDTFSIRWEGYVEPSYSESYTFYLSSDDGARLWVNDRLIIDRWVDQSYIEYAASVALEAGKKYSIRLEYYDNQQGAAVKLMWSSQSQIKQVIPNNKLFTDITNPSTPAPTPAAQSIPSIKVDLSKYYNEDAFSYDSNRRDGNFDGSYNTYSADLFNPNLEFDNSTFSFGSLKNGSKNSIKSSGQKIDVPVGKYSSIKILGAATNGDKSGTLKFVYSSGTVNQSFSQKDWCASNITNQIVYQLFTHRHSRYNDDIKKNYIYLNMYNLDTTKNLSSIILPDNRNMHILAINLTPAQSLPVVVQPGSGKGLKAEYYDTKNFSGPSIKRTDPNINFNWEKDAPDPSMEADSFSVRWTGYIEPMYSENYDFYITADDGVRLWINDKLIIDQWKAAAGVEYKSTIRLNAGYKYKIRMDYYEDKVHANVKLMWSSPSQIKEVIPQTQFYSNYIVPNGNGMGLIGEYFASKDFKNIVELRIDQKIDFNWSKNSPSKSIPRDNFSARWTGYIEPKYTDIYSFHTISDDGVQLWIDDKLIIDKWYDQDSRENIGKIGLESGKKYKIRVQYYEANNDALMKLYWSSPNQNKEIVPKSQLYPYLNGVW